MPVSVTAEKSLSPELSAGLSKLYASSPEFAGGEEAVAEAQRILGAGGLVYVGWFNGKAVSSIMAEGPQDERTLRWIVVHPANRGRGIADRLVSETCRLERQEGRQRFVPGCTAIARLLKMEAARHH
ncbi:MAG: GNAT family N-acetyltransferase [Fluviicoccus sp.]|uniref:GNAT family N-acetyltransferase n=1 Tax=Fluviicoccus sp. TaxID=2003552 RepID=UPI00271DC2D6|nr:GNAT family N-acetyltransferase [Fluviicoccus sp.]MDO8331082.1 GNAT family N-acetyltransferase [Fluviicoccus sp.]